VSSIFQSSLIDWYLKVLGQARDRADLWRVGLEGELGGVPHPRHEVFVLEVRLPTTDDLGDVYFYGTVGTAEAEFGLATDHEHEFFVMSDAPDRGLPKTVAIARLHHYLAEALGDHHTFQLDDESSLRARGYTHALVARADLYRVFRNRNETAIEGRPVRVHSLVLLSEEERNLKVSKGVDALFESFRARGRKVFELRPAQSQSST
jgi:hypothetical protein